MHSLWVWSQMKFNTFNRWHVKFQALKLSDRSRLWIIGSEIMNDCHRIWWNSSAKFIPTRYRMERTQPDEKFVNCSGTCKSCAGFWWCVIDTATNHVSEMRYFTFEKNSFTCRSVPNQQNSDIELRMCESYNVFEYFSFPFIFLIRNSVL